ncbi:MAG: shikimate dehydrogenase [Deltaproteobacteria bacterium]|nr:shikimate dehydrogenase [Deltaproteobacteria bacterium]
MNKGYGKSPDAALHFALFGNPVAQSLSPLMHGAAFAKMGLAALYTAYRVDEAADVVRRIREKGIRGASITIPFKQTVVALLDEVDANAAAIGAVNTISNTGGRLMGYNTDSTGLARDLEEWVGIGARTFVVLGAGGAARAAVFTILRAGGEAVVVNRTVERARTLAGDLGCRWALPGEIGRLEADCLINTTPIGMFPEADRTPLGSELLVHFPRVMDMIYNPVRTRLLRESEAAGCAVRSGVGMFVHQGADQVRLWTGLEPPREEMQRVVLERLEGRSGD